MKNRQLITLILVFLTQFLSAQTIWYHPDSVIVMPVEDSISYMEEYSVFTVVRSTDTTTTSMLWGITENDTLHHAVHTKGIYSHKAGIIQSRIQRDFSRWCVYAYHSGIRMDSAKQHTLRLGSTNITRPTASGSTIDSLSANIEMEEIVFIPGFTPRVQSNAWQSYLAMKYGITLDYAPYIAPSGDTLWSIVSDEAYYHRVVAIGADTIHRWQTSYSASKEGASMHIIYPHELKDGQYILLGDNDGEEHWVLQADGSSQLGRKWRMRRHGAEEMVALVWNTRMPISHPDSVVLSIYDSSETERERLHADSIVEDTAYWFTLSATDDVLTLSLSTIEYTDYDPSPSVINYSAASGTICMTMLDRNKVYSYALYTHLGQLLHRPAPSRPDAIRVGWLPTGIYRIEAFDGNNMVASEPLIIR